MMDHQRFLECRAALMEKLELSRDLTDDEIYVLIDELIAQSDPRRRMRLPDRIKMRTELFNSVRRLDLLQELIDDDTVTEIMVNGTEGIYIERAGRLSRWERRAASPPGRNCRISSSRLWPAATGLPMRRYQS